MAALNRLVEALSVDPGVSEATRAAALETIREMQATANGVERHFALLDADH